jgi:hypothetical protein
MIVQGNSIPPHSSPMPAAPPAQRLFFLDQFRAFITLLVVFHHTAITYGGAGSWYYKEVVGNLGHGITAAALTLFCAVNQAWFMGAFFLIAGYFTPGSFDRKGVPQFFRDRAIRLGIPLLVFGYVLDALTNAIAEMAGGHPFLANFANRLLELRYRPGPLWFVQSLLLFTLAYAGWRTLRPAIPPDARPLPSRQALLFSALGVGATSFAVRLLMPVGQEFWHMQLGYFPSYVALFATGCVAARHSWLARIDAKYMRFWWRIALIALPILPLAALGYRALTHLHLSVDGGFNGGALLYAMWEPFVAWGTILALLWYFRTQVKPDRFRNLVRRAYAIYCFHPPIVVGISVALRAWGAPDAIKFLTVGTLSCVALYFVCGLLLRIPFLSRVW